MIRRRGVENRTDLVMVDNWFEESKTKVGNE